MSDIATKIETITPQLAEKYLKFNQTNRPVRWAHVENLKQEILAGRWFTTHQGIAFGADGNLIDGQHRLLAIQAAGHGVKVMVTRNIVNHVNGDVNLFAMDVIDNGKSRSASDQLHLTHGVQHAQMVVPALRVISRICAPQFGKQGMTTSRAVPLLALYSKEIEELAEIARTSRLAKKSQVFGTICFGAKVDFQMAKEFTQSLCDGDSIKQGDPVYALRQYLIERSQRRVIEDTLELIEITANCIAHTIKGTTIKLAKPGSYGIDLLRSRQRGTVEKVRSIIGIGL